MPDARFHLGTLEPLGASPLPDTQAPPHVRGRASYTLVLAGGGVRGFSHVGVLLALEEAGLAPAAVVGVSMGAIVAATYATRPDWHEALLQLDLGGFPAHLPGEDDGSTAPAFLRAVRHAHTAWRMVNGWGAAPSSVNAARHALNQLLGTRRLEHARIPVAISATDLVSGDRVVFREGPAAELAFASSALAGVAPPVSRGDLLLVDGTYSDLAPIDIARSFGHPRVIVADPSQGYGPLCANNGLEVALRAMEICHSRHAQLRIGQGDLVLRPGFARTIRMFDTTAVLECVAAGVAAVQEQHQEILDLLGAPQSDRPTRPAESRLHLTGP